MLVERYYYLFWQFLSVLVNKIIICSYSKLRREIWVRINVMIGTNDVRLLRNYGNQVTGTLQGVIRLFPLVHFNYYHLEKHQLKRKLKTFLKRSNAI